MAFIDLPPLARSAAAALLFGALLAIPARAQSGNQDAKPATTTGAASATTPTTPGNDEANKDIYGRWRVTKILDAAAITSMSDRSARALIGQTATIAKDAFSFNGRVCKSPSYERSVDDLAQSFREQGHVSSAKMGLPDPVTSIDVGCSEIYLKKPGLIVMHWEGFYFDATRQGSPVRQP